MFRSPAAGGRYVRLSFLFLLCLPIPDEQADVDACCPGKQSENHRRRKQQDQSHNLTASDVSDPKWPQAICRHGADHEEYEVDRYS